jgi:MFS family permease
MNLEEKSPDSGYPSAGYAWYVVVVLTIAYTVSFIDRQIMALMVEPIRRDLEISDTQMSLLLGLAFAVFYTLLGIPIARLADRYSRRGIIAAGIAVWCFMTAACGLSRNYAQLFLARVGVGVGEAALSPSALSMMSDYFPKETRGRAVAFYTMGISMGVGLAMILGGQVIALVSQAPPVTLPVVGQLFAWQTVFVVVGLPGILVAALMLTVREPPRKGRMTGGGAPTGTCRWPPSRVSSDGAGGCTAAISSACRPSASCPTVSSPGSRRCSSGPGAGPSRISASPTAP